MNELEEAAWFIAENAHLNQKYGTSEPYINHVKRVFDRVSNVSYKRIFNREARIVAILHDVVEDSDVSLREISEVFGNVIKDSVWYMTRKRDEPYFNYIDRLAEDEVAKLVKTCDLIDNLSYCYLDLETYKSRIKRYEKAISLLATQ